MSRIARTLSCALVSTLAAVSADAWEFSQNDTHFFELDHAAVAAFRRGANPEYIRGQIVLNFVCDTSLPVTEYLVNVYFAHADAVSWIADGNTAVPLTMHLSTNRKDAHPFSVDPTYGDIDTRLAARVNGTVPVDLQFVQVFEGGVVQYQAAPSPVAFRDAVIAGTAPESEVQASMAKAALLFSTLSGAQESVIALFESETLETFAFGIDANGPAEATDAFWNACSGNGTRPMLNMH